MKNQATIEPACPRCYSTFTYLVDEYDPDNAICEFCGTRLVSVS